MTRPGGPAQPAKGPAYPLLAVLCAGLLLLRRPDCLLQPQFWAEDGTLYFAQAFNEGFLTTILRPASGYLHLFPRLVTGMSLMFPMETAPLVFNLAAFVVQLLPALYLLGPRMAHVVPSHAARLAAALLYVAAPASFETHVNLTNSQWYLALTVVCALVAEPATSRLARTLETLVVFLFSLTGPFSILFLPLVVPRLLGAVKGSPPDRGLTLAMIIAAGAAVQGGIALTSARVGAGASPFGYLALPELMTAVSLHAVFKALVGTNGTAHVHGWLSPAAHGLGLLGLAFLAFVAVRDRVKPLVILLYLAALSIGLWAAFPLNDPKIWLHPRSGSRYFLFAGLFVLFTLLHLALTRTRLRFLGLALLAPAVVVGVPADFVHPRPPDVQWADNAAVFRSLPAGSDFYVPVVPLFHPGMVLHKQTALRGQPPLSRFRPVDAATPASFNVTRPEKVSLNEPVNRSFLNVAGWAVDGTAFKPAGGVLVVVDGNLFPAALGLPADVDFGGRSIPGSGFSRLIPAAEIGPGRHEVSIVVVTADRTGYFRPSSPRSFDMGQFFP